LTTSNLNGLRSATLAAKAMLAAEHGAVDQHTRPQRAPEHLQPRPAVDDTVFGGVADQPLGVAHLVHHVVADVDAGGAADALVLQAVADVDAGGADLHAQRAVDAVAQALRGGVRLLRARAARVAAPAS
jgi:hypothetical protein